MINIREIAFEALLTIDKGNVSNSFTKDILDKYSYLEKRDRSFLARLIEGTIERMITIDYVIDLYSKVKTKKMKPPVRALMRLGVYQLLYMDSVPESAAVNETVKIGKKHGLYNLTGFMNGVLRTIARNKSRIEYPEYSLDSLEYYSICYSCPKWIVELLVDEQGEDNAKKILENSLSVRKVTGRVNLSKTTVKDLVDNNPELLSKSEILPYAVELHNIDNLVNVDDFAKGLFAIQDISSMLVCHLAGIKEDDTVIDVCAAPGGKTCHSADLAVKGKVYSCDVSEDKKEKIQENISRCHFENVEVKIRDAREFDSEFESIGDVVIADLPCSGLGVMGRKNDIKYRLTKDGIKNLSLLQKEILQNVVKYVKPGGILMFSTCTVSNIENMGGYDFIKDLNFEPMDFYDDLPDELKSETARKGFIQLYGENSYSDGFFISKFMKRK